MSKLIKLSKQNAVDDGKFEVSAIKYRSKFMLVVLLFKSATFGLDEIGSYKDYSFRTARKLLIQLDGEVNTLDADTDVTITCIKKELSTIL